MAHIRFSLPVLLAFYGSENSQPVRKPQHGQFDGWGVRNYDTRAVMLVPVLFSKPRF